MTSIQYTERGEEENELEIAWNITRRRKRTEARGEDRQNEAERGEGEEGYLKI